MTEAAFFDLDKTIIAKSSVLAFGKPFYREGLLSKGAIVKSIYAQIVFMLVGADEAKMEKLREAMLSLTKGWSQQHIADIVRETLDEVISPIVFAEALELFDQHHAAGRRVVIVSSAPFEVVGPLGEFLGADEVIATRAEIDDDGNYTGELEFYAYGPFKADAIREIAEREGIDLSASYAYSDSVTDLPMLEAVGHPGGREPGPGPGARGAGAGLGGARLPAAGAAARPRPGAAEGPDDRGRIGARRRGRRRRRVRVVAARVVPRPLVTPRAPLATLPTRLEPMDRLASAIDSPAQLLVKRDDLTGLALGGNKARKLEYLCAEALEQGCDTLVTGGGPQSNHARMTAAAANRRRPGLPPRARRHASRDHHDGNLLLDDLLGATLHFTGARDYYEIETSIDELTDAARRPTAGSRSRSRSAARRSPVSSRTPPRSTSCARRPTRPELDLRRRRLRRHARGSARRARREQPRRASSASTSGRAPTWTRSFPHSRAEATRVDERDEGPSRHVIVDHDHFGDGLRRAERRVRRRDPHGRARRRASSSTPSTRGRRWPRCSTGCATAGSRRARPCVFWTPVAHPRCSSARYEDSLTHEP